jgi:hypothetical protein
MKFGTTLVKGAQPCKVSRLDFLISQTESLCRSSQVKPPLEGKLDILVNMNSAPLDVLSIVKLLGIMLEHHKCHLHNNPSNT